MRPAIRASARPRLSFALSVGPVFGAVLGFVLGPAACAGRRPPQREEEFIMRETTPGVFVGKTATGELRVTKRRYDEETGVATLVSDGKDGAGPTKIFCEREQVTGSHLPRWVCRHEEESAATRAETRRYLDDLGGRNQNIRPGG